MYHGTEMEMGLREGSCRAGVAGEREFGIRNVEGPGKERGTMEGEMGEVRGCGG